MDSLEKSRGYGLVALICVVILFVAMIVMFGFQFHLSQTTYQADESSRHERDELRHRVEVLEGLIEADHRYYGNRGIIQKEMLGRAIEKGWFTEDESRLLKEIASQANYPKDK